VAHRGTIEFETSRGSVALRFREAQAFQERLSQAPGGRPIERQIQLAIDDNTTVVIADNQTAAAVSVLTTWFDELGDVSREMGELLVMLAAETQPGDS
jgi:hypothetical protein